MPTIRIDHVRTKFHLIKWSVFLFGLSLPIAAWFIASDYLSLSRMNVHWVVLGALILMTVMFRIANNYFDEGFARSYAEGGTWDYLAARFSVESRPVDIESSNRWSGPSQLDRKDVVFHAEAGISESGIYVNVNPLGRILLPWKIVSVLKKHRIGKNGGSQQMVSIVLEGPEIDLAIPWQNDIDDLVPKSIGIS